MLTARDLAYGCLDYVGEHDVAALVNYTGAAQTAVFRALVRAINRGQKELFEKAPALFKREVGMTVAAPQTGTIAIATGSVLPSATSLTGAFAGNTILIAGQAEYNQLATDNAVSRLVFPYTGAGGTVAATLYGDALLLDAAYSRPLGPVWLSDIRQLSPIADKSELLGYDRLNTLDTNWGRVPSGFTTSPRAKVVAQPEAYFAEIHSDTAYGSQVRLFLSPLPDKQYTLRFDAGIRTRVIAATDITGAGYATVTFPLPDDKDELWLLPLVLYHWSTSAFFKNKEARQQIADDRARILAEIEGWRVQPQTGGSLLTQGWR